MLDESEMNLPRLSVPGSSSSGAGPRDGAPSPCLPQGFMTPSDCVGLDSM